MRELIKVREVAGSVVVALPQSILEPIGLKAGDRVLLEAAPPKRIVLTKEGATIQSTARLELEIELLEKKKQALNSDLKYKGLQYDKNMPCDEGMSDPDVAGLTFYQIQRDRDLLDVEIAEKRLTLYDLQGSEAPEPSSGATEKAATRVTVGQAKDTHAAQIFSAAVALAGREYSKTFSRMSVRDRLRLTNREWQAGYTAIFQGMRDDHPGGAPPVSEEYSVVFHRTGQGVYEFSEKGRSLAKRRAIRPDPRPA